jgi:hypothetical protein
VDGRDDLLDIDPLQVDAGRAKVAVTELALDDVHRHSLSGELYCVRVAQLVGRKAAPDACLGCMPAKLAALSAEQTPAADEQEHCAHRHATLPHCAA